MTSYWSYEQLAKPNNVLLLLIHKIPCKVYLFFFPQEHFPVLGEQSTKHLNLWILMSAFAKWKLTKETLVVNQQGPWEDDVFPDG